jgi:hypothetical protein
MGDYSDYDDGDIDECFDDINNDFDIEGNDIVDDFESNSLDNTNNNENDYENNEDELSNIVDDIDLESYIEGDITSTTKKCRFVRLIIKEKIFNIESLINDVKQYKTKGVNRERLRLVKKDEISNSSITKLYQSPLKEDGIWNNGSECINNNLRMTEIKKASYGTRF